MDIGVGLETASAEVNITGVDARLIKYAGYIGQVHQMLFGKNLVVTSGKEGQHVQNSYHYRGLAIDVRTQDKTAEQLAVFMMVVCFSAPAADVAVFMECTQHDEKHVHLELHGA